MFAEQVHHFIEQHRLFARADRVLVGVSGGVDSVVLLHVLQQLGYAVSVAHVNYQLRGAAADADEALVRSLCEDAHVPFYSIHRDARTYAAEHGHSVQQAAREIRYAYFQRLAVEVGIRQVAVAHHLDDQVETVLLHLLRGTGPEGLAGMPPLRGLVENSQVQLVRPLLGCWGRDIEAYAKAEGLTWREDASNTDVSYRRNAVRSEILPVITTHFGVAALENMVRTADLLRGYIEDTFLQELAQHFATTAQEKPFGGHLDLAAMQELPDVWRGRVILEAGKRWLPATPRTNAFVDEVKALLEVQVGRRIELETGTIWRERDHLRWVRKEESPSNFRDCYFLKPGVDLALPDGILQMEYVRERPASLKCKTPRVVLLDGETLELPLLVRRWQPGDRMQPFGMSGTKKVSDVLTDAQVPTHQRRGMWVVLSGDEVIWVVGVRMTERVRVRAETDRIVKIIYNPHQSEEE